MSTGSRRWVKVWHEVLSDPDFQDMTLPQQARWYNLLVFTSANGEKGSVIIDPHSRTIKNLLQCNDNDNVCDILRNIKNIILTLYDNAQIGVTFSSWSKYQVDTTSYERVQRYRKAHSCNALKNKNKNKIKIKNKTKNKEEETPFVSNDKIVFDSSIFKFKNLNGKKDLFKEKFPAVDVEAEILRAEAWLMSNPKNTKSNYERFLSNWFGRVQDKARPGDVKRSWEE